MKLTSFLSTAALLGLGVSLFLDLSLSTQLGLFAVTASALFLLGAVRDYAPRRPYWQPRQGSVAYFPTSPARQLIRLAA